MCFSKMPDLNLDTKSQLETYWTDKLSTVDFHNKPGQKMYVLSMFPYPSGQLHMGHMRVYTTADVLARYNRLLGRKVIFPMGWDSFGLPAENAAIERGFEPAAWTTQNISDMKRQMKEQMSLSIDWQTEISTCDPSYYKWTQWIFCRLFERGLVYQRTEIVNWDPIDKTVLADELVDKDGKSWRSGAAVERVPLKQWFIRSTALSDSLSAGFKSVKGGQWRHVIEAQLGWLGELQGVYIDLDLVDLGTENTFIDRISVFTNQPVTVLSGFASFIEINPDNIWWNYQSSDISKQPSIRLSLHSRLAAKHPLSGRLIPIIKNRDLSFKKEECLSSRFGFPLIDINDAKSAAKLNIPFSLAKLGAYNCIKESEWSVSKGMQLNSDLESLLNEKSLQMLQQSGRGGYRCSKLRTDWLISRQRYWGTPIPIIHCPSCGPVIVDNSKLPVELPPYSQCFSKESNENAKSPLVFAKEWLKVDCPKCGKPDAERETDTMDTFVDSSWYFLRFLDPSNDTSACSSKVAMEGMPVDLYIGGMEHAIRHLFYARFISHFLHYYTEIKFPHGPEPFSQFLPVGLVLGQTFQTKSGKYIPIEQVKYLEQKAVHSDTEEPLVASWDKMSKSKHNGICPKSVVQKYGLDSTRLIMLSNTGPDKVRKWQENDIVLGVQNWEKKLWKIYRKATDCSARDINDYCSEDFLLNNTEFIKEYQYICNNISFHYNRTFTISAVISFLQKLTAIISKTSANELSKHSILYHRILLDLLIYLYPISPLFASELWAQLSSSLLPIESVFIQTSPFYDHLFGPWNYNLNLDIWDQKLKERSSDILTDSEVVNKIHN